MKRVLFFYGSYGGGHLSAAKSLKEHIERNYPEIETKLIDCIEYISRIINKLTTSAYSGMAKNAPWAWKKVYYSAEKGVLSKACKFSNKLMSSKLYKCIKEFNPDLIISTHPFSSQMCSFLKRNGKLHCKIATILTDFHIHNQWLEGFDEMDYYFVSNNKMKDDMISNDIDSSKIFVTGIPFSERFLQEYNTDSIFKEFNFTPNKNTVLFFAGGEFGLGKTNTFQVFNTLVQNFQDLQIIAIAGRNKHMKKIFEKSVEDYHRESSVCILDYTKKIPELMSIATFVITKPGGLTTTESLVSGLPMIIINPIPGQEEQNAEFLENSGVAIWLKKNDNINDILKKFLNSPDVLANMKKKAIALAKPNAIVDICNVLFGA